MLCQVGWGQTHVFRFLQKYLIGFKLRLWLGHSRTFTGLSISHTCCVCRSFVLLEGEPSVQSEVLNALDWVFIKAISIVWCIELFFYYDESLSPCHWKTAPQHEAATSTLYFWDGLHMMSSAWFPSNMMLRIEVHQTRESCFSQSEGPLGAVLKIPKLVESCSDVCPSADFSYLLIWSWSSTRVTILFLVTV